MPGREMNGDRPEPILLAAASSGSTPSEPEILATFNRLVKDGVIQYDYSYATETRKINGIHVSDWKSRPLSPGTTFVLISNTTVRIPHL